MNTRTLLACAAAGGAIGSVAAWRAISGRAGRGWYRPARSADELALVTGASSGIGAAFARRLAGDGYNLILAARRKDRLDESAAELRSRHGVLVETVAVDLANPVDTLRLEQIVSELDALCLLVNNAGFGAVGDFASLPIDSQAAMIQVHVLASVRLIRAALPGMTARRRGAIINVSSVAGLLPGMSGDATYGATKSYLNSFSESLQQELAGSGIAVEALCPGMTRSEFHSTPAFQASGFQAASIPGFMWMTAPDVVDAALRGLGRGVICVPGAHNRLVAWLPRLLPRSLFMRGARMAMRRAART